MHTFNEDCLVDNIGYGILLLVVSAFRTDERRETKLINLNLMKYLYPCSVWHLLHDAGASPVLVICLNISKVLEP